VHYFPRDSFRALAKQYFRYGRGRARTLLQRGGLPKLRPLIPFLLVSGTAAMLLLPPAWPLLPPALATYLLAAGAEAIRVAAPGGLGAIATAAAIFPVLHFSHGVGFASGLLQYLRAPDWPAEHERLAPRTQLRAI
jgi:succinoglycan biosynthesis protein ExoA